MAEGLQEADDVLWRDHRHHCPDDDGRDDQRQQPHCWPGRKQPCCPRLRPRVDDDDAAARGGGSSKVRRPAGSSSSSAPVAIVIPVAAVKRPSSSSWAAEDYYGDDDDDEVAFVPPHVALEARWRLSEGRAASSMCEGRGRTLKGRDLQTVRTAVLRMTGFIET
ncbi:protein S40-1-like [Miscanthus floridulus]|uniref:protein S40-1-like n=1 Tax=Miscanthus floridulus TaxID=154761 RepID=UPI003458A44C